MAKSFDAELAALEYLRSRPPAETLEPLRKALAHKNNFIVARAANLIAEHDHRSLTRELVDAFFRFREDAARTDPQCWAKIALAKALAQFEFQNEELFLTGMITIQLEGSWGGTTDSAGPLRATCALGLVQCRGLSNYQVLQQLLPLFADKEVSVQVNAARAVEQIHNDSAALLLRMRAELASAEPELLGACYAGVLHIEGTSAIPWAAKFLQPLHPDHASSEAAFAIADTRSETACFTLHAAWKQTRDGDFRATLLTALALTRHDAAYAFLLDEAAAGNRTAREALEASAPPEEILTRLRATS